MTHPLVFAARASLAVICAPAAVAVAWLSVRHCRLELEESNLGRALREFPRYGLVQDVDTSHLYLVERYGDWLRFSGTRHTVDSLRFRVVLEPREGAT